MLSDADAVSSCGGTGKGTLDVKTAGSSIMFEGAASSAGLKEADLSLCDGAVTVHIVTQVLQPCCASVKALLKGVGSALKPLMLNTTKKADADIKIFQDTLYANATDTVGGAPPPCCRMLTLLLRLALHDPACAARVLQSPPGRPAAGRTPTPHHPSPLHPTPTRPSPLPLAEQGCQGHLRAHRCGVGGI
jgi:hypothetical protein